jgi:hypothetical protein
VRLVLAIGLLVAAWSLPASVAAHDDPIVTIRVLCNGFNVLDMDAVLGEISDSATINLEQRVNGRREIEAWVREQMDHDLRIEITDIGTPQKLQDGYTLTWTARFTRQDWRKAGVAERQATNSVEIRNGRITSWNGRLATGSPTDKGGAAPAPAANPLPTGGAQTSGVPELFGIPVTLLGAVGGGLLFLSVMAARRLR